MPRKLVPHPFSSLQAHVLQPHGTDATNCSGQAFGVIVHPQTTVHLFETTPRSSLTSNHWNAMGEGLGYNDSEILGIRRHQGYVRTFEQSFLGFRQDFSHHLHSSLQSERVNLVFELESVPRCSAPGYRQPPWRCRIDETASPQQGLNSFLRVQAS